MVWLLDGEKKFEDMFIRFEFDHGRRFRRGGVRGHVPSIIEVGQRDCLWYL